MVRKICGIEEGTTERIYLDALYKVKKVDVNSPQAKIEFLKKYIGYKVTSAQNPSQELNALEIMLINQEKR